jgi:arylformamidase
MNLPLPPGIDGDVDYIDLTHRLRNGMPVWPGHPVFRQEWVSSFEKGDIACNHSLCLSEHTGTHFDAPLHFVPGARAIADVPVPRFFGRMLTIEASDMPPDSELPPERILAFEQAHGAIRTGDAVMFHFGWERFWEHPQEAARFQKDWPGLSLAASLLLVERGVRIVGGDCMSIDRFGSTEFPAHRTLLGADILIGENFTNLSRLPPVCYLVSLPLAIEGGSGSPLRAIALVPRGTAG